MNIEELENLNSLKEKGIITQEEFNEQKKIILEKDSEPKTEHKSNLLEIIGGITSIIAIVAFSLSQSMNFACDESSMQEAQDLINNTYTNWNGTLRLSNPVLVEQSDTHLKCRANTNFRELEKVTYELDKQEDGEIIISTNPMAEIWEKAVDEAAEEFENSINEAISEIDSEIDSW